MRRDIAFDFAAVLSRTAFFCTCAAFFLLGFVPAAGELVTGFVLFIVAELCCYGFRRFVKNAGLFVLFHILVIAATFFLVPKVLLVPFIAGFIGLLADSFYCRLRKNGVGEYAMHWAPAGLLVLLYIVGASYGMQFFCSACFYGTICFLTGWMLCIGLSRTNAFLEDSKDMANVPAQKIRRQAGGILSVCSAASFALMLLAPKTILMQLLEWGKQGALFVIRKLLGLVHITAPEEIPEVEQVDMEKVYRGGLFEKDNVQSPLWDILDNIVFILVYAAIFCAAVALCIYVVRKMRELFAGQTEAETDVQERIVPEKRQRIVFRERNFGRKDKFSGSSEDIKIRKLYKRFMEAGAGKHLTPSVTPKELERATSAKDEIRLLYEKARYSYENCTKEEAELMKQQVKKK